MNKSELIEFVSTQAAVSTYFPSPPALITREDNSIVVAIDQQV